MPFAGTMGMSRQYVRQPRSDVNVMTWMSPYSSTYRFHGLPFDGDTEETRGGTVTVPFLLDVVDDMHGDRLVALRVVGLCFAYLMHNPKLAVPVRTARPYSGDVMHNRHVMGS